MLWYTRSGQSAVLERFEWHRLWYLQFIYENRYWKERVVLCVAVHDMI